MKSSCVSALMVIFPADTLSHPQVLTLPNRKMGAQELHKLAHPIPLRGLWSSQGLLAEHGEGQVSSPSSQATGHPVPLP